MPSNQRRALWADKALKTFQQETRCDREDALPDLLCDLMHLAAREGWDFEKAVNRASYHHAAEVAEPEPDFLPRPRVTGARISPT